MRKTNYKQVRQIFSYFIANNYYRTLRYKAITNTGSSTTRERMAPAMLVILSIFAIVGLLAVVIR